MADEIDLSVAVTGAPDVALGARRGQPPRFLTDAAGRTRLTITGQLPEGARAACLAWADELTSG